MYLRAAYMVLVVNLYTQLTRLAVGIKFLSDFTGNSPCMNDLLELVDPVTFSALLMAKRLIDL